MKISYSLTNQQKINCGLNGGLETIKPIKVERLDTGHSSSNCKKVAIDAERYKNAKSDKFSIQEIKKVDNCLFVLIRFGGGCGKVKATLLDANQINKSNPPQRNLSIILYDNDFCEALAGKELLFDISDLKVEGSNEVYLNFKGTDKGYLYKY